MDAELEWDRLAAEAAALAAQGAYKMSDRDAMKSVDAKELEVVWKFYTEIGALERHFSQLQNQYRTLASTWLLATFAAIGFLISKQGLIISIDVLLLVAGIGIAAGIGITLLWNLDLMAYHPLLFAYFREGLNLEREYPWLPQARTNIRERMKGRGVTDRISLFYIAADTVTLAIAGFSLACWSYKHGIIIVVMIGVLWLSLMAILGLYMFRSARRVTERTPGEEERLAAR